MPATMNVLALAAALLLCTSAHASTREHNPLRAERHERRQRGSSGDVAPPDVTAFAVADAPAMAPETMFEDFGMAPQSMGPASAASPLGSDSFEMDEFVDVYDEELSAVMGEDEMGGDAMGGDLTCEDMFDCAGGPSAGPAEAPGDADTFFFDDVMFDDATAPDAVAPEVAPSGALSACNVARHGSIACWALHWRGA